MNYRNKYYKYKKKYLKLVKNVMMESKTSLYNVKRDNALITSKIYIIFKMGEMVHFK